MLIPDQIFHVFCMFVFLMAVGAIQALIILWCERVIVLRKQVTILVKWQEGVEKWILTNIGLPHLGHMPTGTFQKGVSAPFMRCAGFWAKNRGGSPIGEHCPLGGSPSPVPKGIFVLSGGTLPGSRMGIFVL